jgi:hypothetical protein
MGPAAVARWETRTEQQCSPTQVCQDIAKQVPDCRTETVCRQVPVTTQRCTNVPVCQMVTQYRQNCVPVRGSNVPRCSNVPYQQQVCTPRQNCVPVTTQQQQCTPQQKCTTKTVSTKQCRSEQKCTTVTRQVWVPDPAPAAPPAAGAGQKAGGAPPPALPRVPSQQGNTLSPAQQQELARIKQQAEEIQAKLNAYQRQQQQAPVAGGGQKAIATPSHAPSAHQINPQPVPAQAAAGQPAFKSLGSAAGSPPSAPAPTSPSPYSFVRKDNGNVEVFRDGQRISTGTAEYAAQAYGYKPQIPAGGAGQPSSNAPSPAFKPLGTAGNAPSAAPSSSDFVRIETTNGPAFFQKTPSGLAAVSDQSTLQKLRAGAIPSETQPSIAGGADRFSKTPAPGQLQASPAPSRAFSLPGNVGVYSPANSAREKVPGASADRQPTFGSLKPAGTPASHGTPSQAAAIGAAASNSGFGQMPSVYAKGSLPAHLAGMTTRVWSNMQREFHPEEFAREWKTGELPYELGKAGVNIASVYGARAILSQGNASNLYGPVLQGLARAPDAKAALSLPQISQFSSAAGSKQILLFGAKADAVLSVGGVVVGGAFNFSEGFRDGRASAAGKDKISQSVYGFVGGLKQMDDFGVSYTGGTAASSACAASVAGAVLVAGCGLAGSKVADAIYDNSAMDRWIDSRLDSLAPKLDAFAHNSYTLTMNAGALVYRHADSWFGDR